MTKNLLRWAEKKVEKKHDYLKNMWEGDLSWWRVINKNWINYLVKQR